MTIDVHIQYIVRNSESMDTPKILKKVLPKINICKMPIMIKSSICVLTQNKHIHPVFTGECPMDCGGYFVVKGSEKTVLGQERAAENRVYCFDGKNTTKWNWFAEIKSVPDYKCISPKQIEMMIASKNNGFGNGIFMTIPRIKQPVELFVVFRALGILSDRAICEYILLDIADDKVQPLLDFLQASIIDSNKFLTQEDALRHITALVAYTPINMDREMGAKKKREFATDVLNNDLFPHCRTMKQKLYLIGYMAKKLIQTSLGWLPPDDRDSYLNKRIELTGTLLNNLFRNYFNKLVKEMQKQVVREINTGSWRSTEDFLNIINMTNIYKIMKPTTIENGITRALSTGDFSIKQSNSSKVGVAQVLNRLTYLSSLSHLRRINTPLEKSGELIAPRKLHNTTWGYLCLTGDTEVLLSNRMDSKKIREIKDGDWVNTVHRETLLDEPSDIHHFFGKMPDKLYEITTISGRKIKATADHPFLVRTPEGKYEMKRVGELGLTDNVIIRHTVLSIPDENRTTVVIPEAEVLDHYRMELLERHLLNMEIPTDKLKIIARLLGALNTDGHLGVVLDETANKEYYSSSFNVGEEYDVYQLADDIKTLGFGNVSIRRKISKFEDKKNGRITVSTTWEVGKNGAFSYLLYWMGGFVGKKTNSIRKIPEWLVNAELSIKREFLSAFQGGDGSRLSYQKNGKTYKPNVGITFQTTTNEYLGETVAYMKQIVSMFAEFDILCRLKETNVNDTKTKVCIVFEKSTENLARYADVINYTYCEEKRRTSAPVIEHLKIRAFNKTERADSVQYILNNHKTESMETLIEKTKMKKSQIEKIISKNKRGIVQNTRYTTDLIYEDFIRDHIADNGCISVPLHSIREIEPEMVYDFTTRSENHSFVASSFVVSNCPVETPEGQSIGVVKNISYLAHLTIPTNSSSLYEYVKPYIKTVEETTPAEMANKVKVFVNGTWLGISENPMDLYHEMKEKKYKGIINIYTSIVFDFKLMEIRICNDGGRLTRPLLRVKNNQALITKEIIQKLVDKELTWNDLLTNCKLNESVIEYIDPDEQNLAMIAMRSKDSYLQPTGSKMNYTHSEIHPSTIFGVLASCVPFPDHNQAPRNTYQCLDIHETVWMSDGSKKEIKDVQIGEKVLSFHPETFEMSETTVVNHFVRPNDRPVYKLKTVSGREIIATEDHLFMTNRGWKTVSEIKENTELYKIGITMDQPTFSIRTLSEDLAENDDLIILDEETFRQRLTEVGINETKIQKYISSLKQQHLLPLDSTNPKLKILARMMGYLLSDGSLNVYVRDQVPFTQCQFDFGTKEDAEEFENDVFILGLSKCKVLEGSRTFNNTTHHTFQVSHNGDLPSLLICLGTSYGKKTETKRKQIPEWIMNGTKDFRIQFMKGFQGGDGCKIRWNKMHKRGYNFVCAETSQQINPLYKESLSHFMNQCVSILRENDIEVSNITEKQITEDRVKVAFKISDKQKNLIQYYDRIGYSYCQTKNTQSFKIVEYLKAKERFSQKHIEVVQSIRNMYDKNMSISEIAAETNLKYSRVSDILRSYKSNRQISTPNIANFNIEDWMNETEQKKNCIFVPIESISAESNRLVSDIEVDTDNHSFIAGSNFLSHNCAMGKQAMGVYAMNYDQRMDKTAYVLTYPSVPLVDTRVMNFVQINKLPSGTQVHVAIMSHTGYNQEDSILINKGSIDRGMFSATIYHTEKDEDKNIVRDEIVRCKPDKTKTKGIKFSNYDKLNSQGFIPENELVENRDVIIAKIVPIKENRNDPTKTIKFEDQSKTFRTTEETYIDKNYTGRNGDGYNFAKVRVRIFRKPVLGDKFASRQAQKGTCGNIIPECDMPFTKDGLRPDIILNPHAIPSRMTIAQLKETLLGKVLVELGMFGDGTSFGNLDVKTIIQQLQNLGYESYGNQVLYNGLTGEQLETSIFIGPVFYQRLKHMVNDKQHSRSIGPMVNLTRQPAEGRSRDGGFRIGEMERDVMLAHGMSKFCRERMYDASDKYAVNVCRKCGMIASYNDGNKSRLYANGDFTIHLCKTCGNTTDFDLVEIPYAYKLLSQELQTINVVPRLITSE
jgi:DNA-directed RNA polymerase beta subunit